MTKDQFIEAYVPARISMLFDVAAFMQNRTITISEERMDLQKLQTYFVPKFAKNGRFDKRHISFQVIDPEVTPITLKQAALDPASWGLSLRSVPAPLKSFYPVPIATNLLDQKNLILDSNHTLTNLISKLNPADIESTNIPVIRISGTNMEGVLPDFQILNRN